VGAIFWMQGLLRGGSLRTATKGCDGGGWRRAGGRRLILLALALAGLCAAWDVSRLTAAGARRGPVGIQSAAALGELLNYLGSQEETVQLATVNVFFNRRILFRSDMDTWGQLDYWASPLEMLVRGQGDCEDYTIAKYLSLLAVGVAPQRLRLVYVRANLTAWGGGSSVAHMVLAYYPPEAAGDPWILDNLIPEIRPASDRRDLTPVFSFNIDGLWQGTTGGSAGDPLARLTRWRELVSKAREEGLP
jgi:predicted transglutaminase-like cysteine proteinase